MAFRAVIVALALAGLAGGGARAGEGDPAKGEQVFNKCKACHTLAKPPKNGIGPSLIGVFGRTSGTVEGFKYSDAMKDAKIVWSEKTLDTYLKKPTDTVPKTKMVFVGLPKESDRADLIAYLKQAAQP